MKEVLKMDETKSLEICYYFVSKVNLIFQFESFRQYNVN